LIKKTIGQKNSNIKKIATMANNQLGHVEINLSNMIDWSNHQMSQCDLLKSILLVKKTTICSSAYFGQNPCILF